MPIAPIHDLAVKDGDLVAATHGRSFWILDNLIHLRQLGERVLENEAHLFQPPVAYRNPPLFGAVAKERVGPAKNYHTALGVLAPYYETTGPSGQPERVYLDCSQNPPDGAVIVYHFREKPEGVVTLAFMESGGGEVNRYPSGDGNSLAAEAGMNRFVWDLRHPGSQGLDNGGEPAIRGPVVAPGSYRVELRVGESVYTQELKVRVDPRVGASERDLEAQLEFLFKIRDKHVETVAAVVRLRSMRDQIGRWRGRAEAAPNGDEFIGAAHQSEDRLDGIEKRLVPVETPGERGQMAGPHPRLADALVALVSVVSSADAVPTRQSYEVFESVSGRIDHELDELQDVIDTDVSELAKLIRKLDLPAVAAS